MDFAIHFLRKMKIIFPHLQLYIRWMEGLKDIEQLQNKLNFFFPRRVVGPPSLKKIPLFYFFTFTHFLYHSWICLIHMPWPFGEYSISPQSCFRATGENNANNGMYPFTRWPPRDFPVQRTDVPSSSPSHLGDSCLPEHAQETCACIACQIVNMSASCNSQKLSFVFYLYLPNFS